MPGTLSPTMKDIAKRMNVSVTTVSRVIHGHSDISERTKAEVWRTIQEMGYVPNFMAANLRLSKGNMVALVLSDLSKPFFAPIIRSYEDTLNSMGYRSLIFDSYESAEREYGIIRQMIRLNVAGLLLDLAPNSRESIELLDQTGIPYVLANRYLDKDRGHIVSVDNEAVGYLATRHLLARKPEAPVLCINGPADISPTTDRFEGYCRALREAGRPLDADMVFSACCGLHDGYKTAMEICQRFRPPFSIFCSTDLIAIGVLRGLYMTGLRVPEDAAVCGVDDIDVSAYLSPALTTVHINKERIGRESAEMLISMMNDEIVENPLRFFPPQLILRETT